MLRSNEVIGRWSNALRFTNGLFALALIIVSGAVIAGPIGARVQAQTSADAAAGYAFEVAVIKPSKSLTAGVSMANTGDGFAAKNVQLHFLVQQAYGIESFRVAGATSGVMLERFDIEAKMGSSVAAELQKLDPVQRNIALEHMLQGLLADRFKLVIHREAKELPVYRLVAANSGAKLPVANHDENDSGKMKGADGQTIPSGHIQLYGSSDGMHLVGPEISMASLVLELSTQLERALLDKTGLTGKYDLVLHWVGTEEQKSMFGVSNGGDQGSDTASDSGGPSIFTAVQEQLGLKLESGKGPVEVIVVDHAEQPSGN
jgi:uncharacterized protein (TIGR03435 family)